MFYILAYSILLYHLFINVLSAQQVCVLIWLIFQSVFNRHSFVIFIFLTIFAPHFQKESGTTKTFDALIASNQPYSRMVSKEKTGGGFAQFL